MMTLAEAINLALAGNCITRKPWDTHCYLYSKDDDARLKIYINGRYEDYSLTVDDANENDWKIFELKEKEV
jgi:hypothetical protein